MWAILHLRATNDYKIHVIYSAFKVMRNADYQVQQKQYNH